MHTQSRSPDKLQNSTAVPSVLKVGLLHALIVLFVGRQVTGQWDVSNEASPEALVGLLLLYTLPEPVDSQTQNHQVRAQKSLLMSGVVGRRTKNADTGASERVAQLVGKKCKIKCYIHSFAVDCLLDTGAQVSLIDRQWAKTYLSDHKLRPLTELIGDKALSVLGVNSHYPTTAGWA